MFKPSFLPFQTVLEKPKLILEVFRNQVVASGLCIVSFLKFEINIVDIDNHVINLFEFLFDLEISKVELRLKKLLKYILILWTCCLLQLLLFTQIGLLES